MYCMLAHVLRLVYRQVVAARWRVQKKLVYGDPTVAVLVLPGFMCVMQALLRSQLFVDLMKGGTAGGLRLVFRPVLAEAIVYIHSFLNSS